MNDALPIIYILLPERNIEPEGLAGGDHVGAGGALAQHLLDGITGDKMNQQKHN